MVPPTTVEDLAREWDVDLEEFESYLSLIDTAIRKYKGRGAPAVKIGTAYERTLLFERVSRDEAARLYARPSTELTLDERKKLQDFMAHYVIGRATEENLPVQIHTGILARNANTLANGNPENLNNLFLEYPETRFVLLHLSFPYMRQAFSLSKMFPTVFLDFCWVPMLSSTAAAEALDEFLDLVPHNKLMWGGDAFRVEEAYAAACRAREVIASVLAARVNRGDMDLQMAVSVSQAILHGNAREFYGGLLH
jgi:predicted TIM-barrel fold metal-dependent hydrolase